jgi:hypothetical protein
MNSTHDEARDGPGGAHPRVASTTNDLHPPPGPGQAPAFLRPPPSTEKRSAKLEPNGTLWLRVEVCLVMLEKSLR